MSLLNGVNGHSTHRQRCKSCGNLIENGKEYRDAGFLFCRKTCRDFDALTRIEKSVRMH